jgi:hypothetical protein
MIPTGISLGFKSVLRVILDIPPSERMVYPISARLTPALSSDPNGTRQCLQTNQMCKRNKRDRHLAAGRDGAVLNMGSHQRD